MALIGEPSPSERVSPAERPQGDILEGLDLGIREAYGAFMAALVAEFPGGQQSGGLVRASLHPEPEYDTCRAAYLAALEKSGLGVSDTALAVLDLHTSGVSQPFEPRPGVIKAGIGGEDDSEFSELPHHLQSSQVRQQAALFVTCAVRTLVQRRQIEQMKEDVVNALRGDQREDAPASGSESGAL